MDWWRIGNTAGWRAPVQARFPVGVDKGVFLCFFSVAVGFCFSIFWRGWYTHLHLPLKKQARAGKYTIHGTYGIEKNPKKNQEMWEVRWIDRGFFTQGIFRRIEFLTDLSDLLILSSSMCCMSFSFCQGNHRPLDGLGSYANLADTTRRLDHDSRKIYHPWKTNTCHQKHA